MTEVKLGSRMNLGTVWQVPPGERGRRPIFLLRSGGDVGATETRVLPVHVSVCSVYCISADDRCGCINESLGTGHPRVPQITLRPPVPRVCVCPSTYVRIYVCIYPFERQSPKRLYGLAPLPHNTLCVADTEVFGSWGGGSASARAPNGWGRA